MLTKNRHEAFKFSIAGILFGCIFPFLATTIMVLDQHLPFIVPSFISVQQENPLLWIIDLAIPILGFSGFLIGSRQEKLLQQAEDMENFVKDRSKKILERQMFYEALVENSPIAIVTLDPKHNIRSANPAFEEIFDFRANEIIGKNLDDLISDQETIDEAHHLTSKVLSGETIHYTGKRRRSDGSFVDVEILGEPIFIDRQLQGVLGLYRDITAEKEAREKLEASEERFRSLFKESPVALRLEDLSAMRRKLVIIQKTLGIALDKYFAAQPKEVTKLLSLAKIIAANDAALSLFQAQCLEDLQNHIGLILSKESMHDASEIIISLASGETSIEQELTYKALDGNIKHVITRLTILPGHESDWSRVLFSSIDITDRKQAEKRMAYISLHDMMTGLYNRVFFDEELSRLEKSRIRPVTILVADMDNLKYINDSYGHKAGDIALQNIASILKGCFREEDILARIGGDEFAIILPQMTSEAIPPMISRIMAKIARHNSECDHEENIGLSLGYCTAQKNESLMETFKIADREMYKQKEKKKKER